MTTRERRPRGLTPAKARNAGALANWENEGGSLPAPPHDPRDREDAPGGRGRHPRRVRRSQRRGERVMVMVEDDGVGFEPDEVGRGDHFGLLGMRERAEALGGTLTVESAPGAGTTVVVEVPCPSES